MKNYLSEMVDLTGDAYLNPSPAIYDNGEHVRNVNQITSISVHHDASFRPHDYDSVARYHSEAAQHYTRLGPGLQYHYKIDNTGVIFKVRPHERWLYCVGSSENVTTIAICLDGNLQDGVAGVPTQDPTREQFEALFQLLENLCEQHPEFPATWPNVRPHLDFSSTACPGNHLAPHILAIQDKASAQSELLGQGVYDWPSMQPDALPQPGSTSPTPSQLPVPPAPAVPGEIVEPSPTPPENSDHTTLPVQPPILPVTPPEPLPPTANQPQIPVVLTPDPPAVNAGSIAKPFWNVKINNFEEIFVNKFLSSLKGSRLASRKLWVALGTVIVLLANHQFSQAALVAATYLGIQGWVDGLK